MCPIRTAHTIIIIIIIIVIMIIIIIITAIIQPERLSVGTLASRPATAARVPWSFPALLVVDDRPERGGVDWTTLRLTNIVFFNSANICIEYGIENIG